MSHTSTPSTGQPDPDRRTLTRVCTAVLLGSALEWYDYFLYGAAAALVFGQVFFPTASDLTLFLIRPRNTTCAIDLLSSTVVSPQVQAKTFVANPQNNKATRANKKFLTITYQPKI